MHINHRNEAVQSTMPVVFIGHGSPANAIEDNEATQTWHRIASRMERPEAILCISAHWYTHGSAVTAMEAPETIHDFGRSLPAPLFGLQYPAPGKPELAQRVRELLAPVPIAMDQSWGLDHGTWSVLIKSHPEAEIPVVQLSLDLDKPLDWALQDWTAPATVTAGRRIDYGQRQYRA